MITPAQNFLKQQKITYKAYEYKCTVDHDFGKFAASALNIEEDKVFKTIILHHDKTYVTCVVPVNALISLKNVARLIKVKDLEMTDQATASRITGYVIGGISPFGQKRKTLTVISETALKFDEILVMLIDDIILNISELKSISKYDAMKLFYLSPISKLLDKKETGLFTQSAASLAYRCISIEN